MQARITMHTNNIAVGVVVVAVVVNADVVNIHLTLPWIIMKAAIFL